MGCPEFPGYCPAAPAEVPRTSPSPCGSPGPEARDSGSTAPADLPASPDSPTLSSEACVPVAWMLGCGFMGVLWLNGAVTVQLLLSNRSGYCCHWRKGTGKLGRYVGF